MTSGTGRFGAVDVHYPAAGGARAALLVAVDRRFARIVERHALAVPEVAAYRPGHFYERELPALLAVLDRTGPLDLVVVDGYVDLDPDGRPGLGAHLHRAMAVPVIGVAKSAFRSATHAVPVLRGTATRALWITAAGVPVAEAAALVAGMAGRYRLPDALREVDTIARAVG